MKGFNFRQKWFRTLIVLIAVAFLAVMLSSLSASIVSAQTTEPETATTLARLNMREGPGLEYEIITLLALGAEVEFTGLVDANGEWFQVENEFGDVGWVAGQFLSQVPDPETLTVWMAEAEEEAVEDEPVETTEDEETEAEGSFSPAVVTATTLYNLNIRNAPSLNAEILDTLPAGTTVGFTGFMDETGEWVQIDAIGYPVGWVAAVFLSNVPDDLQVADETEEAVMEEEDMAGDEPVSTDVVTATTTANLNLRTNPSLEAEIVDTLPAGTIVIFTGFMDETGNWIQVEVAGLTGWVSADFLSIVPANLEIWEDETSNS